jgi:hypothetical protein
MIVSGSLICIASFSHTLRATVDGVLVIDDAKIDAFVVRNPDYYRAKWQRFQNNPDAVLNFNLAALVGQSFWLAYRKLYLPLFALLGVAIVWGFSYALLLVDNLEWLAANEDLVYGVNLAVGIALMALPALFGNYWYWRKFRRTEQRATSRYPDTEAQERYLQSKGSTNAAGVVALILALLVPFLWVSYQATRIVDTEGFVLDAKGPLTLEEVKTNLMGQTDKPFQEIRRECIDREIEKRAQAAGDPETLDPATIELLATEHWKSVGAFGRRLLLAQAILTKALFVCAQEND